MAFKKQIGSCIQFISYFTEILKTNTQFVFSDTPL